ncbi:MAG: MBOAT family protein [Bacteroidota bacterium]|nr:MBOAT family protein [Bacteroidota bacterium]
MVFNSLTFIVFFIILLIFHNLPLPWKVKKVNLLLASYIFYAAWNPVFILLLWLSTVVDYFVGKALYHQEDPVKKKLLLVISLIGNLGMLCFFKYGGFLLENFVNLVNLFGLDFHPAEPNIILPAGISFYTFTTLCYTIDMYRKESKPVESLLDFSLFVTFFPHLVAGPIVRPPQLVPQFESPRSATRSQFIDGLFLLSLGLFMKVVLADTFLAPTANSVFDATESLHFLDAWFGVFAFSGQIFFDFAGYSTCAIGVASCLGFVLPQNFWYPYAAIGFSDFWKRWHITLSQWLRDYLYIPLGGNKDGNFKTYVNLMITMLLGGLWHGASWTFVVWGGLHGLYLAVERWMKTKFPGDETSARMMVNQLNTHTFFSINFLKALGTFILINITWVFFREQEFSGAWQMLHSMFDFSFQGKAIVGYVAMIKIGMITAFMLIFHWMFRNTQVLTESRKWPWWFTGALWAVMVLLIFLSQESTSSFIYFQF